MKKGYLEIKKILDKIIRARKMKHSFKDFDPTYFFGKGIVGCMDCRKLGYDFSVCSPPWEKNKIREYHNERLREELWKEFLKIKINHNFNN